MAAFVTPFISSAIAFAVPSIGASFHIGFVQVALIPMVFLVPLASFMIFFGQISDDIGRVRIFRYGLLLFGISSVVAVFSPVYIFLITMVTLAGTGSAILSTNSTAIVSYVYDQQGREFALGINAMSVYLGLTMAPFLGGILISLIGWKSVFLLSGPVGLGALLLSFVSMRAIEIPRKSSSGLAGIAFLSGTILSLVTYAVVAEINEKWSLGTLRGFYKCMDGIREMFQERYPLQLHDFRDVMKKVFRPRWHDDVR